MPKLTSTPFLSLVALIIFVCVGFVLPNPIQTGQLEILFGASSFIFGVIIAFFISMSTTRLNEIGQILNQEDANYVSIYQFSSVFGENVQKQARRLLDIYLQAQIDFRLRDFEKTLPTFLDLSGFITGLKPKSEAETQVYSGLLSALQKVQQNRIRIISLVKQNLLFYEWTIILTLAAIVIFSIFSLNDHSLVSVGVSAMLSTSVVMLILVLRDLTHLKWKEQSWIWSCLRETFLEIGLTPYYPSGVINEKRVHIYKGELARVVTYKRPYPDMADKEIVEKVLE